MINPHGLIALVGCDMTMHYTGTLLDGTEFDSSVRKGRPFRFKIGIGQVIQGWDEGVMAMRYNAALECTSLEFKTEP
jgi:FKBP-type peptidyl-prolyl cis-trans isomerase